MEKFIHAIEEKNQGFMAHSLCPYYTRFRHRGILAKRQKARKNGLVLNPLGRLSKKCTKAGFGIFSSF